jgi:hypothetical protein
MNLVVSKVVLKLVMAETTFQFCSCGTKVGARLSNGTTIEMC